jgi:hypothetical protein
MRVYIINLTDHLIRKHRFDDDMGRLLTGWSIAISNESDFLARVAQTLEFGAIRDMNPERLGYIMALFEIGDVMTTKEEIFEHVRFSGDCEDFLRQQVAFCLACVIRDRLTPSADPSPHIPPFQRSKGRDGDKVVHHSVTETRSVTESNGRRSVRGSRSETTSVVGRSSHS